jgi:hypothetical protein
MVDHVEISSLDLRYEDCRLRSPKTEKELLTSILERGIRNPLQGVDVQDRRILLDGFKRYRCAKRLRLGMVPYTSLGNDEVCGIIDLIRISNVKGLGILEQARLITELKQAHHMGNSEIAVLLEKSRSWVSMRSGIVGDMTPYVRQQIFSGRFPAYAFMYTLRRFIRMNTVRKSDIDTFVRSVAGKHLSIRDIDILANAYFKGSDELREQIRTGHVSFGLNQLKMASNGMSDREKRLITTLEIILGYMQRFISQSNEGRTMSNHFMAQANLLSGRIIRQLDAFSRELKSFYDWTGQT